MEPKECLSCQIAHNIKVPIAGKILETKYFNAHQDVAYPIPGLVILSSNRHFYCIDEMTDEEASEFFVLLRKLRQAQRKALNIEQVYYFYNEDTTHHFHMWMVPRIEWMAKFGRSVESLRPILLHAKQNMNNAENIKKVETAVESLRQSFLS